MQEDFIQQTTQQRDALIFQTNLESLQRLSPSELVSEKLNSIINPCIEYAASALSSQECIERFRKIVYSLFSHSAVQRGFRHLNMSLQLLRMVIYDAPNANSQLLANVLKNLLNKAMEDLKETLKKEESIQNENINSIQLENTPELVPFNNSSEDNLVTVSFGTGKDFYHGLKENKLPGYNLEGQGIYGIFVSPHSKGSIEMESRTKHYANNTPVLYFDKPVGITFTVAAEQLFYINHNSHEAIIRQEDLSKIFSSNKIKERYYDTCDFGERLLPPYLFAENGKAEIKKLFDQDTSQFLIDCLNDIKYRFTSPYSRSYSIK